ncbi:outer membrane protein assembly factor BamB family protein [Emticicia agri]|uniref:C-type cytochrome n=1 Tax=Emticicia agri TaxID=2492393 RepID=A0A4Q5LZX0_9BACT|nr:PQQ-binding-like beta-propeller repeat protein [Emticicia agri]RYU95454.1 c-type cytochrome [Emticicia agri]
MKPDQQLPFSFKLLTAVVGITCITLSATNTNVPDTDWTEYNGGADKNHFSPLTQINTANVAGLKPVWQYASGGADTVKNTTQMQCNPIIINGVLYGVSAGSQAFALEAATGKEIWKTRLNDDTFNMTSRGVTYWTDGKEARIFFAYGALMYALNAKDGQPITSFGTNGKINLKDGITRPGADEYVVGNTPATVYKNVLIVGTRVSESASALLGDIRAYDVKTGKKIWTFHTIPRPGEYGYNTWEKQNYQNTGGANSWMGMAIDRQRGIVYVPTGSAAFDFYGGNRKGDNLFANCLLALDAATGKRLWHFQTVHHDIWDRDIPAPPNLFTITQNGKKTDVVSLVSKQGFTFVFNRVTGKPVFPIEERPFPASEIPGEKAAPTQPIPVLPEPFTRQSFTVNDVNPLASNKEEIREILKKSNTGRPFIPLGRERTLFFPGSDGGAQWGGAAVDENSIMYVPAKENPVFSSLIDAPDYAAGKASVTGKQLYQTYCASCHGADREGNHDGTIPGLLNITTKYNQAAILQIMAKGRGMMPALTHIKAADKQAIIDFLAGKNTSTQANTASKLSKVPYTHTGYNRWYDTDGYPVSTPPWGTLTAIDMNTGKRQWQVPLGEYPELTARGIAPTGTDNYGSAAVTAGGLLFIAAAKDEQFRAFDRKTGKILWQFKLPAAGYASPSVYAVNGKQYVVIACGGGKLKSKSSDKYIAFALP